MEIEGRSLVLTMNPASEMDQSASLDRASILPNGHDHVTRRCEEVQAVLIFYMGPFSPSSARFSLFLLSYAHLSIKHEI
ncbi:tRNA pseudouridine synthase A [Gossypium arboreum]|uniref:tRNA pseudouridine synthase A n=1 Tax=Gossypium arboreum TaxID=29729 RepID=A0A0B0P0Q4_GOSAR|nr:tRNA pseudouridine synthase A [Gossypium arboreum]